MNKYMTFEKIEEAFNSFSSSDAPQHVERRFIDRWPSFSTYAFTQALEVAQSRTNATIQKQRGKKKKGVANVGKPALEYQTRAVDLQVRRGFTIAGTRGSISG